ncbi:hypothetical protein F2Q69_00028254 [Brassica cretica]|uniref:Uncharacterized protein n=1 Tax=Brassica cretica TaxID=69181 RepID=A0A8S9S0T2_BRACR|nr:hypothetical protein F2Q69_00028254 [Brassica cretica]
MNFRGNIPTKFSLGIFRGDFRQTSDPRNFLGNLFLLNSVGKFRGISEERKNSEELFPRTCFVGLRKRVKSRWRLLFGLVSSLSWASRIGPFTIRMRNSIKRASGDCGAEDVLMGRRLYKAPATRRSR